MRHSRIARPLHALPCPDPQGASPVSPAARLRLIEGWLEAHAIAVDHEGQPVLTACLADEVVGYRIDGDLLRADSDDARLRDLARQFARRHALGGGAVMLLHRALHTLRHELRQQPGHSAG